MPRPEEELISLLKKHAVDFTASLPCEKIKTLLEMVGRNFRSRAPDARGRRRRHLRGRGPFGQAACHVRPELRHREHDQRAPLAYRISMSCPLPCSLAEEGSIKRRSRRSSRWDSVFPQSSRAPGLPVRRSTAAAISARWTVCFRKVFGPEQDSCIPAEPGGVGGVRLRSARMRSAELKDTGDAGHRASSNHASPHHVPSSPGTISSRSSHRTLKERLL